MTDQDEKELAAGIAVAQFLDNEHIKAAFAKIEAAQFAAFRNPQADEKHLRSTWALAQALDALQQELRAVTSSGDNAKLKRDREKAEATRRSDLEKRNRR